uniref:Uncharacterized protein n=1 Tax=Knipowitschia caucasica TaxID=637954 RepID=A0AAV2KQX5_KNICA
MKTCSVLLVCCLLALAAVGCQSYLALNSTVDLRRVYASLPDLRVHSLLLLHLFASKVYVDSNNKIRPLPSFDPTADFGSHYYGNKEELLDPAPRGCRFYSLGSVTYKQCSGSRQCPPYFTDPIGHIRMDNKGRLIVCLDNNNRILKVYLSQHFPLYQHGPAYDKKHTFEISPQLLMDLHEFHFGMDLKGLKALRDRYDQNINNNQLNNVVNQWTRYKASLGLLIRLVVFLFNRRTKRSYGSSEPIYGWRMWCSRLVFENDKDQTPRVIQPITTSKGSEQTWKGLDEGLQVRLQKFKSGFGWFAVLDEICRGPEFLNPDPVRVTNYARLQLFVRNGYSCFRLYIENCDDWKTNFAQAWVGLYRSRWDEHRQYMADQWQYVTKFGRGSRSGEAETYEYCTGTVVVPGLQARFMLKGFNHKGSTKTWPK